MASQLAHLYQRDHICVPHKSVNMREQYGYSEAAVGGGFRLLCGPDDIGENQELEDCHVRRVLLHLPALQRGLEQRHPDKSNQSYP